DPRLCADELARLGVDPPPAEIAKAVGDIRARLDNIRQQRVLGALNTTVVVKSLEREARDLGYEPLSPRSWGNMRGASTRGDLGKRRGSTTTPSISRRSTTTRSWWQSC